MDAERLGYVGVPRAVNVAFLRHLLSGGYMPVISPVSRDATGTLGAALNVNGDDAAAAIAVALGAAELLLVADVPGVMCDGAVIPQLTPDDARELDRRRHRRRRNAGQAASRARRACWRRASVRISDIAAIDDSDRGTVLRRYWRTLMTISDRTAVAPDALLGDYKRAPAQFVDGDGVHLIDADGKRYLDFVSGIAVNALGYGDAGLRRRCTPPPTA